MFNGAERLAVLAAVVSLAATGLALALTSVGLPFPLAALLAAGAAGVVQYAAQRSQVPAVPDRTAEDEMRAKLEQYRVATGALRHDLRGVLSPALMISDRLVNHQDPTVQRAGQAVVRSVERATALLAEHRETLAAESAKAPD